MKGEKADLSVVFVAACQSEEIGRIFQNNGAKHVICVESKRFVLDKAAIMFTKKFYFELFSRREQVCNAYVKAKNYVELQLGKNESNLFKKFTQDDPKINELDLQPWERKKRPPH